LKQSSGESEVLGPWANYVDQDKTNFEDLCEVVLLYLDLGAATKWLETEHDTNFDTKAEVGPVKLLSISDFVTATGTVQRSAGRGAKRPTYRIPHGEGLKQMFEKHGRQGVASALAWISPRFPRPPCSPQQKKRARRITSSFSQWMQFFHKLLAT
jgi:hypothetical protein